MAQKKGPQFCTIEGCNDRVRAYGLCSKHYQRAYLYGRTSRHSEPRDEIELPKRAQDGRQEHPLYNTWWPRKKAGLLCAAWDDFWKFVSDVGERPSKRHYFVALEPSRLIGPDNFEWREQLRRQPGETKKQFNARAWARRRKHFPSYETNRYLKRKYGITLADYNRMKEEQGGVCAICHQPETSYDPKTHIIRGLSVDHCHTTKKVRGLLCFNCNAAIGRLRDSIDLLDACRAYLVKHATQET